MASTLTTEELKSQLSQLDADIRAELAKFLIDSLGEDPDQRTDEQFEADLARRLEQIRAGTAVGEPAHIVMKRVREEFS